jgi:2-desacetyl-2-hydroxyethyl bacteriochlorophyllide A dehydrogenase
MKAIVKFAQGYGNVEIREIPKPTIKPNEVLIEIKAAGICGTDLHHYKVGENIAIPVVLGHEFSGDVVEIGRDVKGWKPGERIVSETHAIACLECHLCKAGDYHLCKERKGFGSGVNGAFTQYLAVPARVLHRIPESIAYPEATILQPAADVVHAVITNTNVSPDDTVVVIGPGPMGLLTVGVSRAVGAGQVIIVGLDRHKERMEMAKKIGADFIINGSKESVVERVNELTDGRGANVVFETAGSKEALLQGLEILVRKGQLTIIGVHTQPVEIGIRPLQRAEQSIKGSAMSTWFDYERAISLTKSGRLQLKPLVTDVLPITEFEKGFNLALTKKACKVVFTPVG